jgi:pantetheine-phosphate adenylyltransferase
MGRIGRGIRAVESGYAGRSERAGGTIRSVSTTAPSSPKSTHLAIYTGSFDPITLGHVDVLARARSLFDEIVLAIGHNPEKEALFTMDERAEMAKSAIATGDGTSGAAIRVETYKGLTVDFARRVGACAIIRGLRNSTDLATESQLAITNRKIAGIETVFIVSGEEHAYTSSSLIRQMAALGASIEQLSTFVPPAVFDAIRAKQGDAAHPLGALLRDPLID